MSEELVVFAEEAEKEFVPPSQIDPWKVLVVDDEEDIHQATQFGLKGLTFRGQPLELIHAFSAEEALKILQHTDNIAVILLDVVMETEQAGLTLVRQIRENLHLATPRIILRTGQPGHAPELEVIIKYDINDFKNKSELTRTQLFTTVIAALRSYTEVTAITAGRQGLEHIVQASSELITTQGIDLLARSIVSQVAKLLNLEQEHILCLKALEELPLGQDSQRFKPIYTSQAERFLRPSRIDSNDSQVKQLLQEALQQRHNLYADQATVLFFPGQNRDDILLYLQIPKLSDTKRQLLEVFSSHLSLCLDNASNLERLHNHAYNDTLLEIPNRISLANHIDETLLLNLDEQILVLIDIDHFSGINDTLGIEAGDELLRQMTRRFQQSFGDQVFISRTSGDTFGLVGTLERLSVDTLKQLLAEPFELFGDPLLVSTTQGYYLLKDANISGNNAIKRANIALKKAKGLMRGEAVEYTHEMERETHQRMLMLQGLRNAHNQHDLFLAYQPQIDLNTNKVIGLEALIRWRTRNGTMVSPGDFIPLAENSGLIAPIGEWVINQALSDLTRLERRYGLGIQMGINISLVQFRHPNFIEALKRQLDNLQVPASQVEFEITESVAMLDSDHVRDVLNMIHEYGASVAIDDFGTGFSCLSYLEQLQFDRLKIDKSFVDKILAGDEKTHIPEMIINLGRDLHIPVIAEGVEHQEQVERLKQLNCFQVQGYFFGRPMEWNKLLQWLEQHLQSRG